MSDAEYEQDRIEAAEDIKQEGKQVWLVVRERVGGTERTPIYEDQTYPTWAIEINQRLRNLDGSLAPATAHTLMVSTEGLPFDITSAHSFAFQESGKPKFNVLEARPLRPGNVTILWEVDLGG